MKKADRIIITSRDSLEAKVLEIVTLKLAIARQTAEMQEAVTALQARYQKTMGPSVEQLDKLEAVVQAYCEQHRDELFPETKTLKLTFADIGFELNPYKVEKKSKDNWDKLAVRIEALDFGEPFVRQGALAVNKAAILEAREKLTKEQLQQMGLAIERDEQFFIRPLAAMAEATVVTAPVEETREAA